MLTQEPFDQVRFARRRIFHIDGKPYKMSAPEDTILVKLRWAKLCGGSEKQFKDALRVFEVLGKSLDLAYLNHWASELGVEDSWKQIQEKAVQE